MGANHIRHTHEKRKGTTWCGLRTDPFMWLFQDLDHAAYSKAQGSTIEPCKQCVGRAIKALTGKAEDGWRDRRHRVRAAVWLRSGGWVGAG
jgi:hypothetical protein